MWGATFFGKKKKIEQSHQKNGPIVVLCGLPSLVCASSIELLRVCVRASPSLEGVGWSLHGPEPLNFND